MQNKQFNKDHLNKQPNYIKGFKNLLNINNLLTIESSSKKSKEEYSANKISIEDTNNNNDNKNLNINKNVNKNPIGKKKFFKNLEEFKKHFAKSIDIGDFKVKENWPRPPIDYRYLDKNGNSKKNNLIKPIILNKSKIK